MRADRHRTVDSRNASTKRIVAAHSDVPHSRSRSAEISFTTTLVLSLVFVLVFAVPGFAADPPAKTSCEACHANAELFEGEILDIVKHYRDDTHAQIGLSCHDCHGGNPDPRLADDMTNAMDDQYKPNPYRGVPERQSIPEFCGRCHSNPVYMRKYSPTPRVDQVREYWTSQHGIALKNGDEKVATCVDCHGVHGIRGVEDQDSPVHATRVADTCGHCHSDPARMKGYVDANGDPLAVDQVARWKRSVHANAMQTKGDLTAPTCNDCHGNHGAAPPGLDSVTFVCGQCHGRETELFRETKKHTGFEKHNSEYLSEHVDCTNCHEGIAQPGLQIKRFSECVTCHENHAVMRPTVAILGSLPETPCAFCHEGTGPLADEFLEPKEALAHYLEVKNELLSRAEKQGLEGDLRFDWLVDQARELSTHTVQGGEGAELRPEFARLFDKFRIGKTHYTYPDPVTGREIAIKIRQCSDCHVGAEWKGRKMSALMLGAMREITGSIARAERILLLARRGGVEVRKAGEDLDRAVDSQIELEVLVHSFDSGGEFAKKHLEGTDAARSALTAGLSSIDELTYRRKGLFVALGIIVLILIALGLKIRDMSRKSEG